MGIFGRNIDQVYAERGVEPFQPTGMPFSITSPWSPQYSLVTFAVDEALGGLLTENALTTREIALRVPGIKRAHGIHVTMFAEIAFYEMDAEKRTDPQPRWLYTSRTALGPWHRMFGLGSDFFFYGWGCLSFTADMSDCMHVPYGMWKVQDDGAVWIDDRHIPAEYRARPIVIPVGFGENGLLVDAADTISAARAIERAYQDRLNNPVPLTILGIPMEVWERWSPEERQEYRDQWVKNRKSANGATAMKPAEWPIDMPGQVAADLYESGRNAVRLDIANHTSTPASMLEGSQQGGSGATRINYEGVGGGTTRSDLWDYGLAKRWMNAVQARLSLDDVSPVGLSIRGDIAHLTAVPTPAMTPTSED